MHSFLNATKINYGDMRPSPTPHTDVEGVHTRRVHLHDHFIGIVDDRKRCVLGESQHLVFPVFVDDPCGHNTPAGG